MSFALQRIERLLSTLGRDDELRRAILRRRWQGLVGDATVHQSGPARDATEAEKARQRGQSAIPVPV